MTQKVIHLDLEVKESIATHSELTYPFDCCGFVFGGDNYGRYITHSLPVKNILDNGQRSGYKIAPIDYMNAERFAHEEGLKLLGIYHSHVGKKISNQNEINNTHPTFSILTFELKEGSLFQIKALRVNTSEKELNEDKLLVTSSALN